MGHVTPPHWDRSMRDRLRRGEAAALAELYDRFVSLAYAIAHRALDDEEDVGRVTREVFAHLWESPDDFDPDQGPMRSWIAAETHRRALDALRRTLPGTNEMNEANGANGEGGESGANGFDGANDTSGAPAARPHDVDPQAGDGDRPGAPTDAAGPASALRAASTAARADYIVTAMPAPLREALEITRFGHQDYRRMAGALGITESEACRRLRLGLQLLATATDYPVGTPQEAS